MRGLKTIHKACRALQRTSIGSASTSPRSGARYSIPNLIEIQKKSYERFLQMYTLPAEREDIGLQSVFKSVFPISDFRENSSLEFIEYSIGNWDPCGWGDEARGLVHEIGGQRMALKLKLRHQRVPGARHDLRRAAQGHHPPGRLEQGSRRPARRPFATSRSRRSTSETSR